ncbi:putative transcriptional regulatory protein [Vanrija pseudolonga]|uniref:Purtative transcriptional regulatory protein n=1 Tax=Vanrija pseudolonga TaxID=143232 RepID=A0AAF0YGS0_9TREE|nr:purtative transcriptional regulatory protein [Vanrija pseudolonga]
MSQPVKRRAGSSSGQTPEQPQKYKKRSYGHSCLVCRERKIKCEGGENPPCKPCLDTNTVCEQVERTRPPKKRMDDETAAMMAGFEQRLRRLEAMANVASGSSSAPQAVGSSSVGNPGFNNNNNNVGTKSRSRSASPTPGTHESEHVLPRPRYDLGSASRPVYHGELSMFDDSGTRPRQSRAGSPLGVAGGQTWTEDRLRAAARLRHRYASVEDGEAWMDAYFAWVSCADGIVHRPIFLRDMALEGPYFSEFLLIVIYIVGIRLCFGMDDREREAKGEQYVSLAMSMLSEEIMGPGRITTIQALLVLSGRQIAVGTTNQAWMLLGMAIRMMQDMGLHLPVSDDAASLRLSAEDRDMRNRVFWSAYIWDKTMSLALGREPGFSCRPGLSTDSLPQDPDDNMEWEPILWKGAVLPKPGPYPPTLLLKTFALRHYAHLALILESVMTNMYSPNHESQRSLSFIRSAADQLDAWRNNLPSALKVEGPNLPEWCPPPNVILINLLYYTMRILIYRPLLTENSRSSLAMSALGHCRTAATRINEILHLWSSSFGHNCHHYLILYYCFIASGVDLFLIRTGKGLIRDEAFERVEFSLEVLEQAAHQGPCIRRGIVSIRTQLDRITHGAGFSSKPVAADSVSPSVPTGLEASNSTGSLTPSMTLSQPNATVSMDNGLAWFGDGSFWDHQTLLDMLRAAPTDPINTEIPFSFVTDQPELFPPSTL